MLTVMQFTGTGDPMFGGSADDRALYAVGDRYAFLPGHEAQRRAYQGEAVELARFVTHQSAEFHLATAEGRVSGAPVCIL